MAEIRPFRAWRYNASLSKNIAQLTSPLFDVVSTRQTEVLYQNPYNSIHLSVPAQGVSYAEIAQRLHTWEQEGILQQDALPSIYVYYQHFSIAGSTRSYCRKGFICNIKAYDWNEQVLLRHENTIPRSVNDRTALLKATQINAAPTHGLYSDLTFTLEHYMDEAMKNPLYETEDYQGVRDVLAVIQDATIIQHFIDQLKDKQIILADGHHRYTSSLAYRKEKREANDQHTGFEPYNYHLMYLTNTESDDLRILPTHRLINGLADFDASALPEALSKYFEVQPITDPYNVHEVILGKKWAFGCITAEAAFIIRLKEAMIEEMEWSFPPVIKALDLTVLHYFVIEKVLGIPGKQQRNSEKITFSRSLSECLDQVKSGAAQAAFITQDIPIEVVKQVCRSGYTLPQKSTYFYPKVVCGFVFSSVADKAFEHLADQYFTQQIQVNP